MGRLNGEAGSNIFFKSGAVAQLYGGNSKSGRPPNLLIPQPRVKEVESY
jgi:hypothetical protein